MKRLRSNQNGANKAFKEIGNNLPGNEPNLASRKRANRVSDTNSLANSENMS